MALDFEETTIKGDIDPIVAPEENDINIGDLAREIMETHHQLQAQAIENERLIQMLKDDTKKLDAAGNRIAELLQFFNDHQDAIRVSMYGTSKFLIEEEADKAVKEVRHVADEARSHIKTLEAQAIKQSEKFSKKAKREKFYSLLQILLLVLILVIVLTN